MPDVNIGVLISLTIVLFVKILVSATIVIDEHMVNAVFNAVS